MNYLTHVKPLEDAGKTDAQIAGILSTVRAKPVPLAELEARLTLWGVLGRHPATNERTGPLVEAATADTPIRPVAVQLLSWLGSSRSQQISTHTADVSPVWAAGMAAMVAATILTQAQADILNALAGDLVHFKLNDQNERVSVTAQDVADCRTAYEAAEAVRVAAEALQAQRNALRAQFDAILNQVGTVEQSQAVTALRAIADGLES